MFDPPPGVPAMPRYLQYWTEAQVSTIEHHIPDTPPCLVLASKVMCENLPRPCTGPLVPKPSNLALLGGLAALAAVAGRVPLAAFRRCPPVPIPLVAIEDSIFPCGIHNNSPANVAAFSIPSVSSLRLVIPRSQHFSINRVHPRAMRKALRSRIP